MVYRRVYEYTFPVKDYFSLDLPKGAKVLTVMARCGEPKLYALVDQFEDNKEKRNFHLAGTCDSAVCENPETLIYIGTFQLAGGGIVEHVFEIKKGEK